MELDSRVRGVAESQPYPLLFATISGAHLYGFPSPDSDYDVRGAHILPAIQVLGMDAVEETIEVTSQQDELIVDVVTHDVQKFFEMLLKKNGYVLEQLYSPLVIHTSPAHEEVKQIARGCITRHHSHHYLGFAETQWRLFNKEQPRRVKPLLYTYRVLLTGIHLMRAKEVEANLNKLNEIFGLPYIPELIAGKVTGTEQGVLPDADVGLHQREYARLREMLEGAYEASTLPEVPVGRVALNELLIRLRMASIEL